MCSMENDLKAKERRMLEEIDVLRHELRRARDDLERMSGSRHSLEKRVGTLLENIRLCERELKDLRGEAGDRNRLSSRTE